MVTVMKFKLLDEIGQKMSFWYGIVSGPYHQSDPQFWEL